MTSVNAYVTIVSTSKNNRWVFAELDSCLRCMDLGAIRTLIKVGQDWWKHISPQIPNLNSTVISHRSENRRCLWWPVNIINLLFQRLNLVASKFRSRRLLRVPNPHSPIVGASQEDWAQLLIKKGITSEFVNGTSMPIIRLDVFSVRHIALVNCAVFSRCKVN